MRHFLGLGIRASRCTAASEAHIPSTSATHLISFAVQFYTRIALSCIGDVNVSTLLHDAIQKDKSNKMVRLAPVKEYFFPPPK